MTSKFVSVPRELVARIARAGCWPNDADELRAVLADQPQGEPVALPARDDSLGTAEGDFYANGYRHGWNGYQEAVAKLGTLYTHPVPIEPQGEPVALPERCVSKLLSAHHVRGWNACLDEIEKLGPLFTHADPGEVERLLADCWAACGGKGEPNREDLLTALKLMNEVEDEQAAEVGRLRSENEALACNLRGKHELTGATYQHLVQERDTLRAQLAERDALLGEAWEHDISTPLKRKIRAALSASAEPSSPVEGDDFLDGLCPFCIGSGTVATGITESPSTVCTTCAGTGKPVERDDLRLHLERMIGQAEYMLEMAENSFDPEEDEDGSFDECRGYIKDARAALEHQP